MAENRLDPWRSVHEALKSQRSVFDATTLIENSRAMRSSLALDAIMPVKQWRDLTLLSKPLGVQSIAAATSPWKNLYSVVEGASFQNTLKDVAPVDWEQLRSALTIPTDEFRALSTSVGIAGEAVSSSLLDLREEMEHDDAPDAPSLLSEWLLWLPTGAQARLSILALSAIYAVMDAIVTEAGLQHPDFHVTTIVYALAVIVAFLEGMDHQ